MDRGQIVNLMADLRRQLEAAGTGKLTDVQNRLVMQRLENAGTWERPRQNIQRQLQRIVETIASVTGMEEEAVEGALAACR